MSNKINVEISNKKIEVSINYTEYTSLKSATLFVNIDAPIHMVRKCKMMMADALDMMTQASISRDLSEINGKNEDPNNVEKNQKA